MTPRRAMPRCLWCGGVTVPRSAYCGTECRRKALAAHRIKHIATHRGKAWAEVLVGITDPSRRRAL